MISPLGGETVRLKPQEAKGAKHKEKQRLKQVLHVRTAQNPKHLQ